MSPCRNPPPSPRCGPSWPPGLPRRPRGAGACATGVPAIDAALGGGLPRGPGDRAGLGGAEQRRRTGAGRAAGEHAGRPAAGRPGRCRGRLCPAELPADSLRHLVWVRARSLRRGAGLRGRAGARRQLRGDRARPAGRAGAGAAAAAGGRLAPAAAGGRAATPAAVLVQSRPPLVPAVPWRLVAADAGWPWRDLRRPRAERAAALAVEVERGHARRGGRSWPDELRGPLGRRILPCTAVRRGRAGARRPAGGARRRRGPQGRGHRGLARGAPGVARAGRAAGDGALPGPASCGSATRRRRWRPSGCSWRRRSPCRPRVEATAAGLLHGGPAGGRRGADRGRDAPAGRGAGRGSGCPRGSAPAETPLLARYAARRAEPVLVVRDRADFLRPLPLAFAEPTPAQAAVLQGWGIRTLGRPDRAAQGGGRPAAGGGGRRAVGARRTARRRPCCGWPSRARTFVAAWPYEPPVESVEPLLFKLRRFAERVAFELRGAGFVAEALTLTLLLEDETDYRRQFRLPEPGADVDSWLRVLQTHLDTVRLAARGWPACGWSRRRPGPPQRQDGLFDTGLADPLPSGKTSRGWPRWWATTAWARRSRLDSHAPDAFRLERPADAVPAPEPPPVHPPRGGVLRRFRPALARRVRCDGRPAPWRSTARCAGTSARARGRGGLRATGGGRRLGGRDLAGRTGRRRALPAGPRPPAAGGSRACWTEPWTTSSFTRAARSPSCAAARSPEALAQAAAAPSGLPGAGACATATASTARCGCTWRPGRRACGRWSAARSPWRTRAWCRCSSPRQAGYRRLCALLTTANLRAPKGEGRVAWGELAEGNEGLLALTGDEEGPVRRAWRERGAAAAAAAGARLLRDLRRTGCTRKSSATCCPARRRRTSSSSTGRGRRRCRCSPPTACATRRPGPRTSLDVFTCLRHHTTLDAAGRRLAAQPRAPPEDPARRWRRSSPTCPRPSPTPRALAERLEFTLADLGYRFPDYPAPDGRVPGRLPAQDDLLRRPPALRRVTGEVRRQLDRELALIARLGFAGYFLIVWDLCAFARERGHPGAGPGKRGQQRGLLLARHHRGRSRSAAKLLFERFLSRGPDGLARHRPGPAERRAARGGDPGGVPALRPAGRGDDGQRHHLSGAGTPCARSARCSGFPTTCSTGSARCSTAATSRRRSSCRSSSGWPGWPATIRGCAPLLETCRQVHGLPRHLGQHRGGMVLSAGKLDAVRAAGERADAGPQRPPVGQDRLRGHGHRQGGPARASG